MECAGRDASIALAMPGPPPDSADRAFAARVYREEARREGFARVGIARAGEPPFAARFRRWLQDGLHAGMNYLADSRPARTDTSLLLPNARSVICLSAPYSSAPYRAADGCEIARYARGADYHGALRARAERVARRAAARLTGGYAHRVCVDSAPLAERSFAAAAGLGWIGKNGCLIDRELGSYVWLAEIMTDRDLPADEPIAEQCGACVRCLEACPTRAFVAPALLDASRCLAYWTIEHRGMLPDQIKSALGDRVFGCDDCQQACPWNSPTAPAPGDETPPTRQEWLEMGPGRWRRVFACSTLRRAGRRGVQRNAACSGGATRDLALLPALERAACVREAGLADAAAWAARRLAAPDGG